MTFMRYLHAIDTLATANGRRCRRVSVPWTPETFQLTNSYLQSLTILSIISSSTATARMNAGTPDLSESKPLRFSPRHKPV